MQNSEARKRHEEALSVVEECDHLLCVMWRWDSDVRLVHVDTTQLHLMSDHVDFAYCPLCGQSLEER